MNKKYFILMTLSIALLIFSILPILNYIADPSRVLHHDYHQRYAKFHPHKLFLKNAYLIDHPKKYDTLVYGSSRGGFIDVRLISKNAYNMSHGFGTVTNYLHSLKSLLSNGVKVKNVWIGVNDFVIWKDHTPNLHRLIYHHNLIQDFPLYAHWLFRLIPESITILKEKIKLQNTSEVINPNARIKRAREQENLIKGLKRNIPPSTLGYTGIYRINEAVKEIDEIKKLCIKNDINLTVFMYPIFYKTYLRYNQYKIEEFKRKLVTVVDFYDFYALNGLSTNQNNWFEGSHFVTSIGDYMIQHIKQDHFKITQQNIEQRISDTRDLIKNISSLDLGDFKRYSYTIDMRRFKTIFNIKDKHYKYYKNKDFTLRMHNNILYADVKNTDPIIILNKTKTKRKKVIVSLKIQSKKETTLKVYIKKTAQQTYNEVHVYTEKLKKGTNTIRLIMSSTYINNELRIDFTNRLGTYQIDEFLVQEL